jgi:hypothetical protein
MAKSAAIVLIALCITMPALARAEGADAAAPAQAATVQPTPDPPTPNPSSSDKVRDNPAGQYVLVKTVVAQSAGAVDARARPVEPEGYNLLKYCWAPENVLGDWSKQAGLAGQMIVRALETQSWQRDLGRAGYPEAPVAAAIGHYEAALIAAGFAEATRVRAVEAMVSELQLVRRTTPGGAKVVAVSHCGGPPRSLGLNVATAPADGRARFIPSVLHQLCQAQQLDPEDPVRCDYWLDGKTDGPMAFAGETAYSVRWPDGATASGHFDPEESRSDGRVTLRLRPPKPPSITSAPTP